MAFDRKRNSKILQEKINKKMKKKGILEICFKVILGIFYYLIKQKKTEKVIQSQVKEKIFTIENYYMRRTKKTDGIIYEKIEANEEFVNNTEQFLLKLNDLFSEIILKYPNLKIDFDKINLYPNKYQTFRETYSTVGAEKSAHKIGKAIDIPDVAVSGLPQGQTLKTIILDFIKEDKHFLTKHGLYLEDPDFTPRHTHLDCVKKMYDINGIFKPY